MKKYLMILLALALLAGTAGAETQRVQRTGSVWLEGMEEEIVETCYASKFGYAVWVDENYLQPAPTDEACDMYFEAAADGADVSVLIDYVDAPWDDVRGQLADLTEGYPQEALSVETQVFAREDLEYFTRTATADGMCCRYYLVRLPHGMLKIAAEYPAEAAEGYGARIEAMVGTIEILQ